MEKNTTMFNKKYLVVFIVLLVALMTVSVAADVSNTNTKSKVAKDTSKVTNTQKIVKTTENTKKIKTNNKDNITSKKTNSKQTGVKKTNKSKNKKTASQIVLNTSSFKDYVTDGKFNEKVCDGDTVDIQGKLDDPKFAINVNKPVNIVSSTGDAYIDLNTISTDGIGGYKNGIFQITEGSNGTNITGITFHNTRVTISNTKNVHINNITVICETNTGMGVGSFSIRRNSENVTVTNSFFKTIHNGGHSNVVVAGASNCLFENNTVEAWGTEGLVGNTFYLTTYGGGTNTNITIRNNTIRNIIPKDVMMATCWGLVLEGKGHIIENNYLSGTAVVKAQYAEEAYGVVTNIEDITFRNNYVEDGPELMFTGVAYNNTVTGMARLGNIKAYNNSFTNVTLKGNTIFENNTAKKIMVEGNNNTLNNNEVRSEEDYAIIISGENNTVSNNILCSNNGVGDNAITNSTEVILLNNSGTSYGKIYYLNENNMGEYFMDISAMTGMPSYAFNQGVFNSGDILVFNLINKDMPLLLYEMSPNTATGIIIENTTDLNLVPMTSSSITLRNSYSGMAIQDSSVLITLINSTISRAENVQKDRNSYVLYEYPKNNTYVLTSITQNVFDKNGNILTSVNESADILFYEFNDKYETFMTMMGSSVYLNEIYVNKPLNFRAIGEIANIQSNIHFMEGSQGSNITGANFTGNVVFESGNINFYNCTFNKDLILNQSNMLFDGCTFNGKVTLNSSNNNIFNNNIFKSADSINIFNSRSNTFENNTVNSTGEYAIVFDDESGDNIVRYNTLIAASSFGDYSAVGGDNTVEDNTPSYNTQIIIGADSQYFADETPEVTITVNDIVNNLLVTKGYVEVYYDGYFIAKKDLVNGQASVTLPSYTFGNYPIKVWYYDRLTYTNNVTQFNVKLVKSNVTLNVDEFTAKLNEKATTDITFLNQNGNPVQDTNITVTVGRTTYTIETVNGVARLSELVTTEWLDSGKMTITFPDTDMYNRNSTTVTFNTAKADVILTPSVSVNGNSVDVVLSLSDDLKQAVPDGRVIFTTLDGGKLGETRVSNGQASTKLTLPNNYNQEYIIANYTGSYYYNDLTRNIKLSVMLNSSITLETNSPIYGEELTINGKLTNSKNEAIKDANITLDINGNKVTLTTSTEGTYTYTYTPELREQKITVTYPGDEDTYPTSATKTMTIRNTDHNTNEILNQIDNLKEENQKLQEENQNLNNKIEQTNNKIEQMNTQTNNNINTLIKQNQELNNKINTVINQNNNKTTKLNTKLTIGKTTATVGKTLTIKITVKDSNNKAVTGGKVTLKVNGVVLKDSSNNIISADVNKGTATIKYLVPKTWINSQPTIEATYTGNDKFNDSTITKTGLIKVQKGSSKITLTPNIKTLKAGQKVTINVKQLDSNTKQGLTSTVTVKVNGKTYKVKVKNGEGKLTYTVPKGTDAKTIKVTATHSDNYYNKATGKTSFKVTKTTPTIKTTKTTYKSKKTTIKGKILDANNKVLTKNVKVTVKVDGKVVLKNKVVKKGKISLSFKKSLKKGYHELVITSKATKAFNKASFTGVLKV